MGLLMCTDKEKMYKRLNIIMIAGFILFAFFLFVSPVAAADVDATETIKEILNKFIKIVELIFQTIGVILSVYAVGQLILAFKNEDSDSKSKSSALLAVGILLIVMPAIVDSLDLVEMITVDLD